jgi:REP element-mobilizing transposase RayT
MPSTHLSLHYHIVFSTKLRASIISRNWSRELHALLGGIAANLGAVPQEIGGMADHVHLLLSLRATHCLADVVRDLKANSSRWANDREREQGFQWQEGYGAFTVSAQNTPKVAEYIRNQEEHHRVRTFQEEYLALLNRGMVDFDDRYLW